MDAGLAIITSVFGSAGIWGLIQFLISRHDGKKEIILQIEKKLDQIQHKCDRNELAITRL